MSAAMIDHSARAHALISPSSLYRDLVCTAAPLINADLPDEGSSYAREGTYAHEICELMVRRWIVGDITPQKYGAQVKRIRAAAAAEGFDDAAMMRHAEGYKDYIMDITMAYSTKPMVMVEQRLDLTRWIPQGFGTADCVIIGEGLLTVVDFKYGQSPNGRVEADHNPQMIAYALGAYDLLDMVYGVEKVQMHIYQPRLTDGVSSYEMPVADLLAYGDYISAQCQIALSGQGDFAPGPKVCKYCKAKDRCKARADYYLAMEDMAQTPAGMMSSDEMAKAIRTGEGIADWLEDVKARALADCLDGKTVPGYKAVEGRGTRAWSDMDGAFRTIIDSGVDEALLYERKPLTLAAVEKALGKKKFGELVGDYVVKTTGKPALVPESDKRPAIKNTPSAAEIFGAPKGE